MEDIEGGEIWLGVFAGKSADPALLEQLQSGLHDLLQDESIQQKLKLLIEVDYQNAEKFQEIVDRDYAHWSPVIDKLGINK